MPKRSMAVFFILCASIITLVHAIIPHHHHNNTICIDLSPCHYGHAATAGTCDDNQHDDCGSKSAQCCLVIQPSYVLSEILQIGKEVEGKWLTPDNSFLSSGLLPNYHASAEIPDLPPERLPQGQIIIKNSFTSSIGGLRAPPCV